MKQDHDYYRAYLPGEKPFDYDDQRTWPWRLRFIDWLGRLLGVDKIVNALPDEPRVGVLASSNGHFTCTAEHAVECAYLLNLAEAVHDQSGNRFAVDLCETIGRYIDGSLTIEDAQEELRDTFNEREDMRTEDAMRRMGEEFGG